MARSIACGARVATSPALEKRLEWLQEMRPGARRAALVGMPGPYDKTIQMQLPLIGSRLGMTTAFVKAPNAVRADELARDLRAAKVDLAHFMIFGSREMSDMLIGLQVPASFTTPLCVRNGGLISYRPVGIDETAVAIAARILRGEDVRTIPTMQPTSFHLAVNMRTARALGITVPQSIRIQADEVIE
jgi:putative tryptophan/tyrosine transport system substrate-binding protein